MIGYLYVSALRDFMRPRRFFGWLILAVLLILAARGLSEVIRVREPIYQYGQISGAIVFRILALAAAIFSTAVIGQEVEQKTITYLLTRPIARWKVLLARTLAASTVTFVVGVMMAVGASIGVPDVGPFNGVVLRDILALAVGALSYCALFTMVTLVINRAMIVCLIFAFGWEVAVPNMPGSTYYLSLNSYLTAIANRPEPPQRAGPFQFLSQQMATQGVSQMTAWIVISVLTVVLLSLAAWWFTRFEFVPREDTE